ncbi:MAG: pectate lyase [Bacteroidales bacterium]|nr:pectate lyase [Bacteroidales bacterium]
MKQTLLLTLVLFLSCSWLQAEDVPAFPGAEGFARYTTTGGRGGSVYHVTTLADTSSKGSLRYGLESLSGTRTIVFDVSGYIDLTKDLSVKKGNVTIAGQTAPGEGITIRYYTVNFTSTDNIIVRFIRFRRSQIKDVNDGADAAWGRNHKNIIFDHCSFSWSIDEIASFYDNQNFTMQWCTLGEALANPGHSKGEHSYGGIWGGKGASFHHNFLCHMQNRVPRFNGARYMSTNYDSTKYESTVDAERVDFRNCVMYNWGTGGCYGGPGGGYINMINNYYKKGPGTKLTTRVTQVTVGASGNSTNANLYGYCSRYYINGNYVTAAGSSAANYDWKGVVYDDGLTTISGVKYMADAKHYFGSKVTYLTQGNTDYVSVKLDEAIEAGEVTTHTAQNAYAKVLAYAGASLSRDAIDARYMEEARTGTATYTGATSNRAGILDLIQDPAAVDEDSKEQAYYPELTSETRPSGFDSDGDGMPDEWEEANGLNKNSNDAAKYTLDEKGWYTNLECYLNWLVQDITKAQNEDALSAVEEYYPSLPIESSDISATQVSAPVIRSVEYFSLDGHRLQEPADGICIRRIIYRDGLVSVEKVIRK